MTDKIYKRQVGGTLLGLVIGLVIGLAIAVVVAIMITKTSTPFTNKLGLTRSDAPAVQLSDPNKPLYGSTARELMANAAKPGDPAAAAGGPVVPPAAGNAEVRPPDTLKPETRPDAKSDARADSRPVKVADAGPAAGGDAATYYLQVGAFRDAADAESARAKLALIGIESSVSSAEGDSLYRVRIGPYANVDNVNRMRAKLSENNIDVAVIKTPK